MHSIVLIQLMCFMSLEHNVSVQNQIATEIHNIYANLFLCARNPDTK